MADDIVQTEEATATEEVAATEAEPSTEEATVTEAEPHTDGGQPKKKNKKRKSPAKIAGLCGFILLCALLVVLTVNSMLCIFVPHYYPTYGGYRLFAIVSDSMEPEIPTGDMIVGRKPKSADEIEVGTVITYELKQGNSTVLITHRVITITTYADGVTRYQTRGDNAEAADSYRPVFDDIVGIYTGNKCGFFGYFFGFLQSTEGAIALIIILLIMALTLIIVHFVNIVTVWRKVALDALKASGSILWDTQIEELGTIADVLAIVSKDPLDKGDISRKDKKLNWFIKTGTLPKRPYKDELEEGGDETMVKIPKLMYASDGEEIEEVISEPYSEVLTENNETLRYSYTVTAKLIRLKPKSKEWYSAIKNELLSYDRVRAYMGGRFESFRFGRGTIARIAVRGKTLCLLFAADPEKYDNTKYHVEAISSSTPCMYRIKSARRARYALELITQIMEEAGATKNENYEQQDYYMPYVGIVSLLQKGLVKRRISSSGKTYQITEIDDVDDDEGDEE